jgi:chromosome partitioning protein
MEHPRADDGAETEARFYCSQQCLGRSHTEAERVECDACTATFRVTHAAHVCYQRGQRRYACSSECRNRLLSASVPLSTSVPSTNRAPELVPAETKGVIAPARPTASASHSLGSPRVIAVFNHKGGTGKTTTSVTVASGLATRGYRTLLADTDAQGNVAVSLGLRHPKRTLYHVLVMGSPLAEAVIPARPNMDVLVSNETLAAAELYLAGRQNRDRVLSTKLAPAKAAYDYIIVDCSPSLSLLNQNALVFSDAVLCPVACDYLSLVGVSQVVKTIKNVNRLLNHPVQLWGVLPTLFDKRARICNEALQTLQEHFGERCLPPIRSAIRVKEAPSQGKTLFEYDADSGVASDYARVVERLVQPATQLEPYLAIA